MSTSGEARFPLAAGTTPKELAERLTAIPSLRRETDTFWNWLDEPRSSRRSSASQRAESSLAWNVTMEDGSTVLGNIELKGRWLSVSVNSASRAERAITLLRDALAALVGLPLTQIQTFDQVMEQQRDRPPPAAELPPDVQTQFVHATLDKQYRAVLDQTVPMLGNLTPRAASRTKTGRDRVVVWLKHLENRSKQSQPGEPIAAYDFAWLWRELKVEHLRR